MLEIAEKARLGLRLISDSSILSTRIQT